MILVKDVAIAIVQKDDWAKVRKYEIGMVARWGDPCKTSIPVTIEDIEGQRFRTEDGRELIIGMTQAVQDSIGLPMQAFKNMNEEIGNLRYRCTLQQRDISFMQERVEKADLEFSRIYTASAWKRLVWLFKGIKYVHGRDNS